MKRRIRELLRQVLRFFYPQIPMRVLQRWPVERVFVMGIFQRILRIHSDVPWPVHWSSIVSSPDRIERRYPDWATPGFNMGQYIQARNGIVLGKHVRMGPGVKVVSADHDVNDYDIHVESDPIVIEDYCWLGANSVILPGVKLAEHTVVAAGAVVTKSILQGNCIVAGAPARVVKELSPYRGNTADEA
jgi:hypothetical protein